MPLDNSMLIAPFCPATADGDTFIYTEMLDRGKRKGNNGVRLLKTFYHRSVDEFWEQWPTIKKLCDLSMVRACTRLAPRSYKSVGELYTRMVVEAALTANWQGMKSLYNRACGIVKPNRKLWLWDVDEVSAATLTFVGRLSALPRYIAQIPSRKGLHVITEPFDVNESFMVKGDGYVLDVGLPPQVVQRHKDNPTNLYIPDGAD